MREAILEVLRSIDGVLEGSSVFSTDDAEPGFFVDGRQVAHLVGPNAVELRLTKALIRENRDQLRSDPRAVLRSGASDWLTLVLDTEADLDLLRELAALAAVAHLPSPGAPPRLPPAGADLARRRRFH